MRVILLSGLKNLSLVPGYRFRLFFCLSLLTLFYMLACASGNKTTYDSLAYLAAAKSLSEGMGLLNQFGAPYVAWPPLYPLVLSAGVGWIQTFVFLLHLLCGLGTLFLWDKIAMSRLRTAWLQFLYLLVLSISTPFLMLFVFVWSEAIFILLFTAYLYALQSFVQHRKRRAILLATLFAFLMLLQRNAGIFILAGSIGGMALNYTFFDKRELKYLLLHGLFAASGFTLWNLYVVFYQGHEDILTEVVPKFSFLRNVELVLSELGKLYVPESLSLTFGAGILLPCLLWMCFILYRQKDVWLRLLMVILLTYLTTWVIIPASESDISRFLAVSVPVVHLFAVVLLEEQLNFFRRRSRFFIFLCAGLWLMYPFLRILSNAMLWHKMNGL